MRISRPIPKRPASLPVTAVAVLAASLAVVDSGAPLQADDPPEVERAVESTALDVDARAAKLVGAVRDQFANGEWQRGIDRLEEITRTSGGKLVKLAPRRYVGVRRYANLVLSGLPAEGLAVYRRAVDPKVVPLLERARRDRDEKLLWRIVTELFASSHSDEALVLLGDLALERGDTHTAREAWTRLVPIAGEFPLGEPRPRLRHPDPDLPLADVLARLVAVTVAEGRLLAARSELESFAARFEESRGTIGGRDGRYVELLTDLIDAAERATKDGQEDGGRGNEPFTTFGGRASRNGVLAGPVAIGERAWSAPVTPPLLALPTRRPALVSESAASTHPLVWRNVVLVPAEGRISAYDVGTGLPWPDEDDTPVLYRRAGPLVLPRQPVVGVPRFTLTIDDGLLFARMGSAVTGIASSELANLESELVCLDLAGAEGRLLARITAKSVSNGESGWSFEGPPVVRDGVAFVALRRINPRKELAVARLELEPTGRRGHAFRVVWRRSVAAAIANPAENRNEVTHLLLALAGRRVFLSTDFGGILALDVGTGDPVWATTYESRPPESIEEASDPTRVGLVPPVVLAGTVFVAPTDSEEVMALDAGEGFVRWRRRLPDRVCHVLGVGEERLIVSGRSLWALDVRTGGAAWAKRRFDPENFGFGRGLLAGEEVWWPQRTGLAILSQRRGRPANGETNPHWYDLRHRGLGSGNLGLADGRLLLTSPRTVVGFSKVPKGRPKPSASESSSDSARSEPTSEASGG